MAAYVWLFPILFIFHDMEEIIGLIPWYQKNKKCWKRDFRKAVKLMKMLVQRDLLLQFLKNWCFALQFALFHFIPNAMSYG